MKQNEFKPLKDKNINLPEIKITDTPGITQQRYKMGLNVEGSSGGRSKTLIFERLASVGTGLQSFTGFGFTPTNYTIQATRTDVTSTGYPCFSDGAYDGTTQIIRQVADGYSRILTDRVLRVFYTNQGGGATSAEHSSLDTDGVTLNFTFSAEDCYLVITCFG